MRRLVVALVLLVPSVLSARAQDLAQWRVIEPARAVWTRQGASCRAEGLMQGWSALLAPADAPANCRLECTFTIGKPARPGWRSEHTAFCRYRAGREDSGYDLAVILRHADGGHFCRIQFSSRSQEVAIWKPSGGFVHVRPAKIAVGKAHRLAAQARGDLVEVFLDGQQVARYHGQAERIGAGAAGLAVYGADVRFEEVEVLGVAVEAPKPPPRIQRFHWRTWRGREWVFDGDEPIAIFDRKKLSLWEAKLKPGFRPVLYWELFWKQYDGVHNYSDRLDHLKILKQDGPELVVEWRSHDPSRRITTSATMTVGFDKELGSYAYDVRTQFVVNPGKTWQDTADGLEYCNLIPYNVVGPATWGQSDDWPWWYRWVVYTEADGTLAKHPLSHNRLRYVHPKPDGGFYGFFGNNAVNPVVFFHNPTDPSLEAYSGLCHWAFDIHFRYRPYKHKHVMPAGTKHVAHYRVVGFDAARSKEALGKAKLHPYFAEAERYPIYVRGRNAFHRSRGRDEPQREYEWRGGDWDRQVGHDDRYSIRLTGGQRGKDRCIVEIGGSRFSEPVRTGVYTITAYVKTQDVTGEGATVGVQLLHPDEPPAFCRWRATGTAGWRRVHFSVYLPKRAAVRVILELRGKGTAWFDDVQVEYPRRDTPFLYEAERLALHRSRCEVAGDPQATGGRAVRCVPGTHKPGGWFFGPYSPDEPLGDHVALFRLKVADNRTVKPVAEIDVHEESRGVIAKRTVLGTDFRAANVYQYFALPFSRTLPGAMQYRAESRGGAECWADHVAVVPRRELWDEDLAPGAVVDQAQWLRSGYWAVERVGQTFVATGTTLERIDLLAKNRTCTLPGTLRLWEWKGGYKATVACEPLFADVLDLTGPDVPQARHWLPRVAVQPGKTYFVETQKVGHHAGIIFHDADACPGGTMFVNGEAKPGRDVTFVTWTRGTAAPQPGTPTPLPRLSRPSRLPPLPSKGKVTRQDYLDLVTRHVEANREGWLRTDGKHGHRQAFWFAFMHKMTGAEPWAELAVRRFRASAKWRADHPGMHVGFGWLPPACLACQWIAKSPAVSAADHTLIRELLLDSATRFWPIRERGAMNRSMGGALGLSLVAKLFPNHEKAAERKAYAQAVWNDWAEHADTDEDSLHYNALWWEYVVTYAAENGLEAVYQRPAVRRLIERYRDQVSPLGPLPPYGDCYGWGFEWGGWVLLFEKAAGVYRDGTFAWAAHRVLDYHLRHIKNTEPHLATYEDMWKLALACVYAPGDVPEQAPAPASKLLTRKEMILLPVAERRAKRTWFVLGPRNVPDKLVLRGSPDGLFAVFNLMPLAGHGHFDAPALVTLTDGGTALLTDTCYGDRAAEHHSQMLVKRLRGGKLVGRPPSRVNVTRFVERPELTFCEVETTDYTGWGATLRRRIFFARDRFLWVSDEAAFSQAMEASVGPLWHAAEAVARGPSWLDVAWPEPRGFRWTWRNGGRRLLVAFVPQDGAVVDCQLQRWKEQRLFHEWSPPLCLFQRRPHVRVDKDTTLRFDTLLIPHGPAQDPAALAQSIRSGREADGTAWVEAALGGKRVRALLRKDEPILTSE